MSLLGLPVAFGQTFERAGDQLLNKVLDDIFNLNSDAARLTVVVISFITPTARFSLSTPASTPAVSPLACRRRSRSIQRRPADYASIARRSYGSDRSARKVWPRGRRPQLIGSRHHHLQSLRRRQQLRRSGNEWLWRGENGLNRQRQSGRRRFLRIKPMIDRPTCSRTELRRSFQEVNLSAPL